MKVIMNCPTTLKMKKDKLGWNSLYGAAMYGKLDAIKLLKRAGMYAEPDYKNNTPLHVAAQFGY